MLLFTGFRHCDYIHNEAQSRYDRRLEKPACGCHMGASQVCINLKVLCLKSGMFSTINTFRIQEEPHIQPLINQDFEDSFMKNQDVLTLKLP